METKKHVLSVAASALWDEVPHKITTILTLLMLQKTQLFPQALG